MHSDSLVLRQATVADAAKIASHRCDMFVEMGRLSPETYEILHSATVRYLERGMPAGEYVGFLVEDGGKVVAGGGVHMRMVMPRPNRQGLIVDESPQALVVNIYTHADYRRRGLATRVMRAIEAWAHEQGIPWVVLHASDMGRPMYEGLGYLPTNELIQYFDSPRYRLDL